jgi:adenylylsulfate kinase
MYKKARQGEINDFTGIDSPYEKPSSPDLILNTQSETINECLGKIKKLIE